VAGVTIGVIAGVLVLLLLLGGTAGRGTPAVAGRAARDSAGYLATLPDRRYALRLDSAARPSTRTGPASTTYSTTDSGDVRVRLSRE
jgi:hypothetical protein